MILLSAGHHAQKPGACFNGFCEYDEAVRWCNEIFKLLPEDNVLLVPFGTLKEKISFINARMFVKLAVEIHFNSTKKLVDSNSNGVIDDKSDIYTGSGCEVLYNPGSEKGKSAAQIIQNSLIPIFKPDRGIKPGYYRLNPKYGVDNYLKRTRCTSLIIEPAFIHNKDFIIENRNAGCKAIADALLKITE